MLDKNWKKYLGDLFHYTWIWFISWAISHWFFSSERSFIMAIIWFILFVLWELIVKQNFKDVDYLKILFVWVLYSLSVWMINWWLQHFLDSPERSLWIIPLWFLISLLIYSSKENITFKEFKNNLTSLLLFSIIISSLVIMVYLFVPLENFIDAH